MQSHPTSPHIQLVATATAYNLTTQDLAEAMPLSLLSSMVTQLLHAMRTFPGHQQVSWIACCGCIIAKCKSVSIVALQCLIYSLH